METYKGLGRGFQIFWPILPVTGKIKTRVSSEHLLSLIELAENATSLLYMKLL